MITSKQRSLIGLAALFAIASTQACGSDDPGPVTPAAGAPGSAGSSAAGAPATAGAAPATAGAAPATAGAPAGGGGSGGAAAGAPATGGGGGAPLGGGGSSGGSAGKGGGTGTAGGSAAGAGGGGSSTATYAAVKTIFAASCGTGMCHNGNPHTDFQKGELHTTLTTVIPNTPAMRDCKGSSLITANDGPNSLLVKIIKGATTCQNSGMSQNIARMPMGCGMGGANPACLTDAQIKTISDWITAGAPQ